jgi:hypothetical protein
MEDMEEDLAFYESVRRIMRSMQRERLNDFARSFFAFFNDKAENYMDYPRSQGRFLDILDRFEVNYADSGLRINLTEPFVALANVILTEIDRRERELEIKARDGLLEARETRQFYVDIEASRKKLYGNDFL